MSELESSDRRAIERVDLVAVDRVDPGLMAFLCDSLGARLDLRVRIAAVPVPVAPAFDRRRGQYRSSMFVRFLDSLADSSADRVLGVTRLDLYVPHLNFVFGEAMVGGRAAVVSLARLDGDYGGLVAERRSLRQRAVKEALHELGHTFGLEHCRRPGCVMRFSNSLGDVDSKGTEFCAACRERLEPLLVLKP